MKFTCQTDIILKEIEYAINFIGQRSLLSINSNIYLQTESNILTIKSTDNKIGFFTTIPVETNEPGTTTVIGNKFLSILKTLPKTDLCFEEKDEKISIYSAIPTNKFKFNIKTLDATSFPQLQSTDSANFFTLAQRDFFDMIDKVAFSVCEDENRIFLTGTYLEKKDGELILVATDGKRMAMMKHGFEQEINDFIPVIIPVKFLNLLKLLGTGEGVFQLAVTPSTIFANINNHFIYSVLIGGQYPNYARIIPAQFSYECKVNISDMLSSLIRISQCVDAKSKRIYIEISKNGIMLSGENTEIGDGNEIIPCEYEGEDTKISFNYTFLLAPLKKMDGEQLKICFNSATSVMGIYPEPERDYFYIIMPMQN